MSPKPLLASILMDITTGARTGQPPMPQCIGSLPHVTGLILNGGSITIGRVEPLDGIAVAAGAAKVLATLVRREDETVEELLRRLDAAVGQAVQSGAAVNEIKGAELFLSAPMARKRRKR
jgi:hypothetical protein